MGTSFTQIYGPQYFCLWGYLKNNVYQNNPPTIAELKVAIAAKIKVIV